MLCVDTWELDFYHVVWKGTLLLLILLFEWYCNDQHIVIYTLLGLEAAFGWFSKLLVYLKKVGKWFDISSCLVRFNKWDVFVVYELYECLGLFIVTNCSIWTLLLYYSKCCCAVSISVFLMVSALHMYAGWANSSFLFIPINFFLVKNRCDFSD